MIDDFDSDVAAERERKRDAERRQREQEELRQVLDTRAGRGVVWRLLEHCGVFQSSYHDSPQRMAYLEGQRAVGLKLLADVHATEPMAHMKMAEEARQAQQEAEAVRAASPGT